MSASTRFILKTPELDHRKERKEEGRKEAYEGEVHCGEAWMHVKGYFGFRVHFLTISYKSRTI